MNNEERIQIKLTGQQRDFIFMTGTILRDGMGKQVHKPPTLLHGYG